MTARKVKPPPPTSDQVRRNLIQWFYELNAKGGKPRGMRDLCKGIKEQFGHNGPLVKQHLTFLIDLAYIFEKTVMTTI